MSDDSGDEDAELTAGFYEDRFKRFEELGEDQVSSMLLSGEILPQNRDAARVWLGRKARDRSKKIQAQRYKRQHNSDYFHNRCNCRNRHQPPRRGSRTIPLRISN